MTSPQPAPGRALPPRQPRHPNEEPQDPPPLQSAGAIVFVGLSYLFAGFAFSYVDRSHRTFGIECALWLAWAVLGFGAGVLNQRGGEGAGRTQWRVLGLFGLVLAVFPGFVWYSFARWVCLVLLIVMGARAARLRTRRDLYLTLVVIFTVCFLTTTHYAADWSLWFYLGPAWLCGALALAWLHAEGVDLSRWTKLFMTMGFVAVSFAVAASLFLFAPRPPVLGFGFLPGGDVPGLYDPPFGDREGRGSSGGEPRGSAGQGGHGSAGGGAGASGDARAGQSQGGQSRPGTPPSPWDRMLGQMREAGRDPFAPQWQRGAINGALDAAQALRGWLKGTPGSSRGGAGSPAGPGDQPGTGMQAQQAGSDGGATGVLSLSDLLLWLALLLAGWLLWRTRYRWGLRAALGLSWLLALRFPARSMQVSARAMGWCLRVHRHPPLPGQSVREHWSSARGLAPLARTWLGHALESYCATRFGGVPATRERALRMRQDVLGAAEVMMGTVPELSR